MIRSPNAKCCVAAFMCVFLPSRRAGSCDSFYCHTVLGALTASSGPSETPNVNLMTWRCANDKHARWRWQPFSSICMIFLPPLTPSSFSQVLFSKSQADVSSIIPLCIAGSHCCAFQQHWKLPSNLHVLCIMQKTEREKKLVLSKMTFP